MMINKTKRLPSLAPPLYRWEEGTEDNQQVADSTPKRPYRGGRDGETTAPTPRRRYKSPPRNPMNIDIPSIPLKPMTLENGVEVNEVAQTLSEIVGGGSSSPDSAGVGYPADVTLLFCVRRAGCGLCREHGLQLTEIAKRQQDVKIAGIIKETGVDDDALIQFYTDYFNFPLYRDDDWQVCKALGDRKISVWKLLACVPKLAKRYAAKGIDNVPLGGDIFTHGGILVFDKNQRLRFVYYEKYGDELDETAIECKYKSAMFVLLLV